MFTAGHMLAADWKGAGLGAGGIPMHVQRLSRTRSYQKFCRDMAVWGGPTFWSWYLDVRLAIFTLVLPVGVEYSRNYSPQEVYVGVRPS